MSKTNNLIPLVVDLDGTLLKADLPSESFVSVMLHRPLILIQIIIQTAVAKLCSSSPVSFKVILENKANNLRLDLMPWSESFLQYLQKEKRTGRRLVLCTGSTQGYADQVGKMLNLFESTWGSIPGHNLIGKKKALFLVDKYGEGQFDYAGNATADLKVAPHARHFILVNPTWPLRFLLHTVKVKMRFQDKNINAEGLIHCLGLKLCLINSGILLVLVFFQLFYELVFSLFVFSAFNFLAISASLFFCICNVERDRTIKTTHKKKQCNLFASGDISILYGLCFASLFLCFSILCFIKAYVGWLFCLIGGGLYILCVRELVDQSIQDLKKRLLMYFCASFFVAHQALMIFITFLVVSFSKL